MTSDEEKQIEGIEKTEPKENSNEGDNSTSPSIIERADAAAERLEKANKEYKILIARQEELVAKQALGGFSSGPREPEQPKQPEGLEYLKQVKKSIEERENLS